ncbi:MAG TPA: hypothetical protein VMA72_07845 [Streptosporangiaceae bacterium]|nr:hypothetical protein [Streptosporangiaceae bacterium]
MSGTWRRSVMSFCGMLRNTRYPAVTPVAIERDHAMSTDPSEAGFRHEIPDPEK